MVISLNKSKYNSHILYNIQHTTQICKAVFEQISKIKMHQHTMNTTGYGSEKKTSLSAIIICAIYLHIKQI